MREITGHDGSSSLIDILDLSQQGAPYEHAAGYAKQHHDPGRQPQAQQEKLLQLPVFLDVVGHQQVVTTVQRDIQHGYARDFAIDFKGQIMDAGRIGDAGRPGCQIARDLVALRVGEYQQVFGTARLTANLDIDGTGQGIDALFVEDLAQPIHVGTQYVGAVFLHRFAPGVPQWRGKCR